MTDPSAGYPDAGQSRGWQAESADTDPLELLNEQAEVVRAKLAGLQQNLSDVQQHAPMTAAAELQQANEQLVLAALHAESIAEQAVSHLDSLARSSQHDALTGTPNRALMLDRLENAIAHARRHRTHIAVLFVDLDEFKQINDTLGHTIGDAVVQLVARRLESVVRHSDTVSRHGGDEFLVLIGEISQPSDAAMIAEKMLAELAAPSQLDDHLVSLSASIGIALFPEDGTDPATLITRADAAMYCCKKHGGSNFHFYSEAMFRARYLPRPPAETRYELSPDQQSSAMRTLRDANEQLLLAAAAAQDLQERSEQKHARQIQFMAMAAHELRNVLVPIRTAAGLLKRADPQDLREGAQNLFETQLEHLSLLVEDLLDCARANTGNFRVQLCLVDIADVIRRAVAACRPEIAARQQRLTMCLPPDPLYIGADPMRLTQIFRNLLDNASGYTPEGGEIALACESSTDTVVITVSDNGVGIPKANLESIFELFVHDERPEAFRSGRLGIGLAVVRDLVKAHGGTVVARSPGQNLGSKFIVTLPTARYRAAQ